MRHQLTSGRLTATVDSKGAELCSLKDDQEIEYLWQADPSVWPRHAPVLFPIVGKLKNNTYTYGGKRYEMAQHGFARDMEFKLVDAGDAACVFELRSTPETLNSYPFEFILTIGYKLEGNRLSCSYAVNNPSQAPLLFSIGAHPGFNCRFGDSEMPGSDQLLFERDVFLQTTLSDGLRSGKSNLHLKDQKLGLSAQLFANDALVFEDAQINRIKLQAAGKGSCITMDCTGWPYFGIWNKKGNNTFVCLEPWQGVADEINTGGSLEKKQGIVRLAPNDRFDCSFSIEIG